MNLLRSSCCFRSKEAEGRRAQPGVSGLAPDTQAAPHLGQWPPTPLPGSSPRQPREDVCTHSQGRLQRRPRRTTEGHWARETPEPGQSWDPGPVIREHPRAGSPQPEPAGGQRPREPLGFPCGGPLTAECSARGSQCPLCGRRTPQRPECSCRHWLGAGGECGHCWPPCPSVTRAL